MSLAKFLPVAVLLLHAVTAEHELEFEESTNDLGLRFYDTLEMRTNIRKNIESFVLLSINYPSSMSFRYVNDDNRQIAATIERTIAGQSKRCSFQPFNDELTTYNVKLRSLRNDIEIFEAMKIFKEPKDNLLDLFVVNMTDCRVSKTTLFKGYDFAKDRGAFIVLNHRDYRFFDIFSLNGKSHCGSYICRRRYYLENGTLGEPTRFELLDGQPDWRLTFMAASSDWGYYSLVRQKRLIRLLSLTADGSIINSTDERHDSKLRFLRISTANDLFGACYIEEKSRKEAWCLQLDRQLEVKFNRSLSLPEEPSYLTIFNLPQDGFILTSASCASEAKERCESYNVRLTKYRWDGSSAELPAIKDENCSPRRRHEFQLYEDRDGQLCLFYACSCADGAGCEEMMRNKCLGSMKDF